jgi:TetR/AcrR family acrAB operon transcriptional repressor
MVRRTKEAAAATREQLVEAAERVFRERGVTRTSLAEVAAAAGVTRGAVYWHFRDKVDLFDAMCARATSPMRALLDSASEDARTDALTTLHALFVHALTHLATDARAQAFFEIVFHKSELVGELARMADRNERECRSARKRMEALLKRAVVQRALPAATDVAIAAHTLHGCLIGLMHEWVIDPEAYDLAGAAPAIADLLIGGLRAAPPRKRGSARRIAARSSSHRTK